MANKHLGSAKINSGKIDLPENVMDFLFCLEGERLEFVEKDGEVVVRRSSGRRRDPTPREAASVQVSEELEAELEELIEIAIEESMEEVGLNPSSQIDEFIDVLVQHLVLDLLTFFNRQRDKGTPLDFSNLLQNVMSGLTGGDPSKFAESFDLRKMLDMFSVPPFQGSSSSKPHTKVVLEDIEDVDVDLEDDQQTPDSSPQKRYRIPIDDDEEEDSA
ncbi:MAG: hypothetical protein ACE5OZ_09625 [Candidatus Heimdallarchaeota archaeon]